MDITEKTYLIIPAGGAGSRMGKSIPKQFLPINGLPMLMHTINAFNDINCQIIIALHPDYRDYWDQLVDKHDFETNAIVIDGGATRFDSVKRTMPLLPDTGWVAVHDAARPFVSKKLLKKCYKTAFSQGNAVPVLRVTDSLRMGNFKENVGVPREACFTTQTPQIFPIHVLKEAYGVDYYPRFTDDAAVVEFMREKIYLLEGEEINRKITTPYDLEWAEKIAKKKK